MATTRALTGLILDSTDTLTLLQRLRDQITYTPTSLNRTASAITTSLDRLATVRRYLKLIRDEANEGFFVASRRDWDLFVPSLQMSLDDLLSIGERMREGGSARALWGLIASGMTVDEGVSLIDRLGVYVRFLRGEVGVLRGEEGEGKDVSRRDLVELVERQRGSSQRVVGRGVGALGRGRGRGREITEVSVQRFRSRSISTHKERFRSGSRRGLIRNRTLSPSTERKKHWISKVWDWSHPRTSFHDKHTMSAASPLPSLLILTI
ncbi:hypothetical protein K470DRAFT_85348 [Piedraia hortae CBS 480.64]|uniref:Uncharacterized protein n=1 Tax=Piedraia hortae CBS 480.64 TaxID=1314780 RepID=A0A6A7C8T0_9PEZI|nr:hypothetical protein K470DRAFT_85348 [Piedraia hortae CBS 480.64]